MRLAKIHAMTAEELIIIEFMKQSPESGFSRMEIARKAVKRKQFEEDPRWADAPLNALMDRKVVVLDKSGAFRLPKDDRH